MPFTSDTLIHLVHLIDLVHLLCEMPGLLGDSKEHHPDDHDSHER